MSDLLGRVREAGLLRPGRPVVVLLSGGRDSVCLLDVAVTLDARVRALHVNYGLRDEAPDDERFCADLCARFEVPLEVRSPRRPEGNLQAWARDVRYAAAAELALRHDADVAAGHTASDQAETILYRLAASPGRRALLGMPVRSGRLVRPLLAAGVTREETAEWCRARGLAWREDASNAASKRGRVRELLRELHPAAEANVLRTAALLGDEAAVLDALVADVIGEGVTRARLGGLPRAVARLVLVRLAEDAAGAGAFLAGAAERLDDVLTAPDGADVAVGGGVDLVVRGGIVRARRRAAAEPLEPVTLEVPGEVAFGGWTVSAAPSAPEARDGVLAARGPFTVRAWQAGDRMAPLGMGGHTRSLQDLFTDRKVPREERARVPVVECDGEIAWVPGVATSERFRVQADTASAVALDASARTRRPPRV
jgi:tRNA(Ile)-lysidine synthase